jgi:protein-S-isoprenylcysteine O-methyltransferase Ste14
MSAAGVLIAGVAASGLGPALTPSPVPTPGAQLRRDGMFGRIRHPIYSGLLAFASGRVLTAGPGRVTPAVALLVLLDVKARWEEQLLTERFAEYTEWHTCTARRTVSGTHR